MNKTQDKCFVRSWGSGVCSEKGFVWRRGNRWQLRTEHIVTAVVLRATTPESWWRGEARRTWGAQRCRHRGSGDEQLGTETPRVSGRMCRGAVQLTGGKCGFVLQVGGSKEETANPGWTRVVTLGSVRSEGLHWKDPAGRHLREQPNR